MARLSALPSFGSSDFDEVLKFNTKNSKIKIEIIDGLYISY